MNDDNYYLELEKHVEKLGEIKDSLLLINLSLLSQAIFINQVMEDCFHNDNFKNNDQDSSHQNARTTKLTGVQMYTIKCVITSDTEHEALKKAGINKDQYDNWLKDPEFEDALEFRRKYWNEIDYGKYHIVKSFFEIMTRFLSSQ